MVIASIFEHARKQPGKLAIAYGTRNIGYGELASWIAQARAFLSGQELRERSLAVLCLDGLVDSWVLGLASRSLGMTTISVGSPERIQQLNLRDVGCVVVTKGDRPLQVAPTGTEFKLIRIPQYFYLGKAAETVPELPETTTEGGHILLTSGTTGTRKKVLLDAEHMKSVIKRRAKVYDISERSIVNVFNFGTWTGTGYKMPSCVWSSGGAVVIHQFPERQDSLRVEDITHAFFTPETLANLLRAPANRTPRSETMRAFVGGAALPRALASDARARLTPHLFTYIGSTEAGPWALTRIERDEDVASHSLLPAVDVEVVDENNRLLPAGQTGAVRVRTLDMVTGYLDDEEATRATFRHGYFYPGDLGAFQPDGRLALQGRVDNVINVLGNKRAVEPMELALQESLAVEGVCVLAMQNGADEEFHVVIESRRPIDKEKLSSSIGAHLRGVPYARVRYIDALPRNETGKIDRAALRQRLTEEKVDTRTSPLMLPFPQNGRGNEAGQSRSAS